MYSDSVRDHRPHPDYSYLKSEYRPDLLILIPPVLFDKYGRRMDLSRRRTMYAWLQATRFMFDRPSWAVRKAYVRSCGFVLPGDSVGKITVMTAKPFEFIDESYGRKIPHGRSIQLTPGGTIYTEHMAYSGREWMTYEETYYPNEGQAWKELLEPPSWDGSAYASYGDTARKASSSSVPDRTPEASGELIGRIRIGWDWTGCIRNPPAGIDPKYTRGSDEIPVPPSVDPGGTPKKPSSE